MILAIPGLIILKTLFMELYYIPASQEQERFEKELIQKDTAQ